MKSLKLKAYIDNLYGANHLTSQHSFIFKENDLKYSFRILKKKKTKTFLIVNTKTQSKIGMRN